MKKILLLSSLLLFAKTAFAEPIKNVDEFQTKVEQCIKGKKPDECLNTLLIKHLPPGNEAMAQQLPNITGLLVKWLGGSSVYALHHLKTKKLGDIVDIRHYAIESSGTGFMVLQIKYLKILGKPYLFGFNLSSTDETINALLSGNL